MGLSQTHKKITIGRDPDRFIQHQMIAPQGQSPAILKPYFERQISAKYQMVAASIKAPWLFFLLLVDAADASDNLVYHLSIVPRFNILRANVANYIINRPGIKHGQSIFSKYFSSFTKIYDPDKFLLKSKLFGVLPFEFFSAMQVFPSIPYATKDKRIIFRRKKIREAYEHLIFNAGNQGRYEQDNAKISKPFITSSFLKSEQLNISQVKTRFLYDAIENWRSSAFKSSLSNKPPMLRRRPMDARNLDVNLEVGEPKGKLAAKYITNRRSARIAAISQGNLFAERSSHYQVPLFHELSLSNRLFKPGNAPILRTATIQNQAPSLHKKTMGLESNLTQDNQYQRQRLHRQDLSSQLRADPIKSGSELNAFPAPDNHDNPFLIFNHFIPNTAVFRPEDIFPRRKKFLDPQPESHSQASPAGRNKISVSSEMPPRVNRKRIVERKIKKPEKPPSKYSNISNFMEARKLRPLPMILLNHRPTLKTDPISKTNNPFFHHSTQSMVDDSFTDGYVVGKKRNQWASKVNSTDVFKPGQQQEKYQLNPFAEEGLSGGVSRYRHLEDDKNPLGKPLRVSPGVRQTSLAAPEFSANKPYPAMTHHYTHQSRMISETIQAKKTVRKEEIQMADDSSAARSGKSPSMADFNVNGLADKVYELILGRIKRERAMRGH